MSDEAGLDEIVNLVNSQMETASPKADEQQLEEHQQHQQEPVRQHQEGSLLLPVNVKRFALFLDDVDD